MFINHSKQIKKPPMKEKDQKQQFAPPTYPSNEPFPTKAIIPKTTGTSNAKTPVCSASVVTSNETTQYNNK